MSEELISEIKNVELTAVGFPIDKYDDKNPMQSWQTPKITMSEGDAGFGPDAFLYFGALRSGSSGSPIGHIKNGKFVVVGLEQADRRSTDKILTDSKDERGNLGTSIFAFSFNGGEELVKEDIKKHAIANNRRASK